LHHFPDQFLPVLVADSFAAPRLQRLILRISDFCENCVLHHFLDQFLLMLVADSFAAPRLQRSERLIWTGLC